MRCDANGKTELTIAARIDETHTGASQLPAGGSCGCSQQCGSKCPHLPMHRPDRAGTGHLGQRPGPAEGAMDDLALVRRRPGKDPHPPATRRATVLRSRGDRLVSDAPHPAPAPQRHRTGSICASPSHRQADSRPANIRLPVVERVLVALRNQSSYRVKCTLPPFGAGSSPCNMIAKAVQNQVNLVRRRVGVSMGGDDGPCKAQDRLLLHALAPTEPRPLRRRQ